MVALELWLIRHAESVWNAQRRWQGRADPPLSPAGVAQAQQLAARLSGESLDRIVASDLRRAFETAVWLAAPHGLEPRAEPRLREHDVGRWEGQRRHEIERFDAEALARFDAGAPDSRAGGGESREDVARRVGAAMTQLVEGAAGLRLAVVTHLGVLRCLLPGRDLANAGFQRLGGAELDDALQRWR